MAKFIFGIFVGLGVENYFWLIYWLLTENSKALQILQLHHAFCKQLIQSDAVFIGVGGWFAYELFMWVRTKAAIKRSGFYG